MSEVDKLARAIRHGAVILCLLWLASIALRGMFEIGMDPTDAKPWDRSNMGHHRDAGTGCEYLSVDGAIIPRLGRDGKQICGPQMDGGGE